MPSLRFMHARGFTYIEMLASLAIISLIASISFPLWTLQQEREKEQDLRLALREIRTAIDTYKHAYDEHRIEQREGSYGYPKSLGELVEGVVDVSTPDRRKLYFLRRIPLNPYMAADVPRDEHWIPLGYREQGKEQRGRDELFDIKAVVP
ncbi:general secretion pathway protein G [Halopseudomonas litoralis]|uniref:General secretion pathway protein G n=1 Tax=Halopseudomonas litoralis TaxID=797277 RepID=A0A1H1QF57_9GAMM|nr:type II secretion system protein [Halopseudomonas litoralis]SDS21529.1 general secretion pathway protein G [Halopseudomonas litoralis]